MKRSKAFCLAMDLFLVVGGDRREVLSERPSECIDLTSGRLRSKQGDTRGR